MKFDEGKTRYDLIDPIFIESLAQILTMGAQKYEPNNWQHVDNARERYTAALYRHIIAWQKGEKFDQESGLHHLAHATCNLMFLMHGEPKSNEDTNIQRCKSNDTESDTRTSPTNPDCRKTYAIETDKHLEALFTGITEILDGSGSPERIRACLDNFCARRRIAVLPSPGDTPPYRVFHQCESTL